MLIPNHTARRTQQASVRPYLLLTILGSILGFVACDPGNPLVSALRDSDQDGWYDENRNQHVELFIDRIENRSGTSFAGQPAVAIDDRIVVAREHDADPAFPAASRSIGTWGAPETNQVFQAELRVSGTDISAASRVPFTFKNSAATFSVPYGNFVIHLRSTRTRFSDPSPTDAQGDFDLDGIGDAEEAKISSTRRSVGNPRQPDLLLVVGFTHPDWKITRKSIDLLTSVFFDRKQIRLNVYTGDDPLLGLTPGQVEVNGSVPERNHKLALAEGRIARSQLISTENSELFHALVLAEELNTGQWGLADVTPPANDLIVRSHLPVLGPDALDYQAKVILHELGHNLGLCHPTESDATCPSGAIPVAERNGGRSAMGTPAESAGPIEAMVEALARPMDYSPSQWRNLQLFRLRAP